MIHVLIVEAFWACRAGWKTLIASLDDRHAVIETDRVEEVPALVRAPEQLDLVLLGLPLPETNSYEAIAMLRDFVPEAPIVVLAAPAGRSEALRAIEVGAMGFIPKTVSAEDTLHGVRRVLAGEVWIAPEALTRPDTQAGKAGRRDRTGGAGLERLSGLTRRQRDVLAGVALGKTNAEIAAALGLSTNTVRLHVSAILKTLGVSNRTQAAKLASETDIESSAFKPEI